MNYLVERYKYCHGMIIDLRQNGGGAVANIPILLSLFDNHGQKLYSTQIKSGPGHGEFTDLSEVNATIYGEVPDYFYHRPVAVLIDRGSFSATSFFAICCMAYDNVKLFGDGWTYRFSITRTLAIDGQNYENGVPPDVRVLLDPAATAQGLDNVIETAADWICGF